MPKKTFEGIDLSPYWKVWPPWVEPAVQGESAGVPLLRIHPGEAFGTGEHETTQLCLLALGFLLRRRKVETMLDFGAGSGILAIGAARYGARVEAVEIDERSLQNARHNAKENGVESLIDFRSHLSEPPSPNSRLHSNYPQPATGSHSTESHSTESHSTGSHSHLSEPSSPNKPPPVFDLVCANILKGVLLDFAGALCSRLSPQGEMLLSGLVATDVPEVLACYNPLLPSLRPQIYSRGSWRALLFRDA